MTSKYAPGMRAIIRDEEWLIRQVTENAMGNETLHCVGVSPMVRNRDAVFLTDLEDDIRVVDPADVTLVPDSSPHLRKTQLYVESLWRQQIPADQKIHVGHKAAMDLMPFQLEPASVALKRPRQRILIADAVGLGKTLEAGILMSELVARGKGRRILVVTVKSMMQQFQKEMWNRFTIPLVRLDSQKIHSIRAKLPSNSNPFYYYDKSIVSIDTLKRDLEYRTHLENAYWDIIVIDEAQNVAERGEHSAQRARLAKLLANRSDTMIMLSATPHDGRARSFASLMTMLDPTAIANPEEYTKDDIHGLCIRRFKKDVRNEVSGGSFLERHVVTERCDASAAEEAAYDVLADMKLQMDFDKAKSSHGLFKTNLEKALFSSPAACIKSIDERLRRLEKCYDPDEMPDIEALGKLRRKLEQIGPEDLSKYQRLLSLLRSKEYGWSAKNAEDRLVIFTERIETMKYLTEHLRRDLGLSDRQVKSISGSMSDREQQEIVEEFGRDKSSVRILVASDVASEGLNLHYLSHRLIHFDIPWSLMVFQQRNGRIDRYGQQEQPDIRYMLTQSTNDRIKGDLRIIEILIQKEMRAQNNIGDPGLLMGKFTVEEQEGVIRVFIEDGLDADAFEEALKEDEDDLDIFELLMKSAADSVESAPTAEDTTLFTDRQYMKEALVYFNQTEAHPVEVLDDISGLEVKITPDMRSRLMALLPDEIVPASDYMQLSADKQFCMQEIRLSMQKSMDDSAWPQVQYLWKQHPLFSWINEKASLLYGRNEVPLVGSAEMDPSETVYIVSGGIPNRKSALLVDEWFGVLYKDGTFAEFLSMDEVLQRTRLGDADVPNMDAIDSQDVNGAQQLLQDVVTRAKVHVLESSAGYKKLLDEQLNEELGKLDDLRQRRKEYQMQRTDGKKKSEARVREVDRMFDTFVDWASDTLELQDQPHVRIVAAAKGIRE